MRVPWASLVLATGCVGACSSTDDEVGTTGAVEDAGPSAPSRPRFDASVYGDGAPWNRPSRISIRQRVRAMSAAGDGGFLDPSTLAPLEGVEVCLHGYDPSVVPCAETDTEGWYELHGLPKEEELTLTFDKDGYQPVAQPLMTFETSLVSTDDVYPYGATTVVMLTSGFAASLLPPGSVGDPAMGTILFGGARLENGLPADPLVPVDGLRVSVLNSDAAPTYLDDWTPIPEATSSFADIGLFANVEPGRRRVRFEHDEFACEGLGRYVPPDTPVIGGFFTSEINEVEVMVLAGYWTRSAAVFCAGLHSDGG